MALSSVCSRPLYPSVCPRPSERSPVPRESPGPSVGPSVPTPSMFPRPRLSSPDLSVRSPPRAPPPPHLQPPPGSCPPGAAPPAHTRSPLPVPPPLLFYWGGGRPGRPPGLVARPWVPAGPSPRGASSLLSLFFQSGCLCLSLSICLRAGRGSSLHHPPLTAPPLRPSESPPLEAPSRSHLSRPLRNPDATPAWGPGQVRGGSRGEPG